jgi:lysine-specific demethylase 8
MKAIEVRDDLTPAEFIGTYLKNNTPVVLKDGAPYWKERWTPESLKKKYGTHPVLVESNEKYIPTRTKTLVPLADLIDTVQKNSLAYRFRSMAFLSQLPDLQEEFRRNNHFSPYFKGYSEFRHQFWITPKGNATHLHHDSFFDNLNIQIFGRKHFVLIPPSAYSRLYTRFFWESPIDPLCPDPKKYPRFQGVELYEANTEAGDIMFIPQLWWHFVTTVDLSINLNTWAKSPYPAMREISSVMPLVPRTILRASYNRDRQLDGFGRKLYTFYARVFSR